ncbi:MAG: hypothetical protein ABUL44_01575 [Flavobacterium sp.]
MKVCIAEKPSVAHEIASVLGANSKHDGYYEGNGSTYTVYEILPYTDQSVPPVPDWCSPPFVLLPLVW